MSRFSSLFKKLKELEVRYAPWQDNDGDGFLSAVGALPGESAEDALRRQAAQVWTDYPRLS